MSSERESSIEGLIEDNLVLARRLARRFSRAGDEVDPDLQQVAVTGLFLAACRYDPDVGPFRPFAMVTIVGELKKHLRSNGWVVRVPRRIQEASIAVGAASERLSQELGRAARPQEVADETGLSLDDVLLALGATGARFPAEVDEASRPGLDRADGFTQQADTAVDVQRVARQLSPDDRDLVHLRFYEELTQRQIAARLGLSQSQVHRRIERVLTRLRAGLVDDETERGRAS